MTSSSWQLCEVTKSANARYYSLLFFICYSWMRHAVLLYFQVALFVCTLLIDFNRGHISPGKSLNSDVSSRTGFHGGIKNMGYNFEKNL